MSSDVGAGPRRRARGQLPAGVAGDDEVPAPRSSSWSASSVAARLSGLSPDRAKDTSSVGTSSDEASERVGDDVGGGDGVDPAAERAERSAGRQHLAGERRGPGAGQHDPQARGEQRAGAGTRPRSTRRRDDARRPRATGRAAERSRGPCGWPPLVDDAASRTVEVSTCSWTVVVGVHRRGRSRAGRRGRGR